MTHRTALNRIELCFGRELARLAEIFGVAPSVFKEWLAAGTFPREHEPRLRQLSLATEYLLSQGVKPSADTLCRPLAKKETFLSLLARGASGLAAAEALVKLTKQSDGLKPTVATVLAGRRSW